MGLGGLTNGTNNVNLLWWWVWWWCGVGWWVGGCGWGLWVVGIGGWFVVLTIISSGGFVGVIKVGNTLVGFPQPWLVPQMDLTILPPNNQPGQGWVWCGGAYYGKQLIGKVQGLWLWLVGPKWVSARGGCGVVWGWVVGVVWCGVGWWLVLYWYSTIGGRWWWWWWLGGGGWWWWVVHYNYTIPYNPCI